MFSALVSSFVLAEIFYPIIIQSIQTRLMNISYIFISEIIKWNRIGWRFSLPRFLKYPRYLVLFEVSTFFVSNYSKRFKNIEEKRPENGKLLTQTFEPKVNAFLLLFRFVCLFACFVFNLVYILNRSMTVFYHHLCLSLFLYLCLVRFFLFLLLFLS